MPSPKKHTSATFVVVHSPALTSADDWKRWVLLPYFEKKWRHFGLDDDDLAALQVLVMMDPKGPPLVKGTGGLRKVRFRAGASDKGKSGAYRVGYAYFEQYGVIVAITAYAKSDKSGLTSAERSQIKKLIEQLEEWVANGG